MYNRLITLSLMMIFSVSGAALVTAQQAPPMQQQAPAEVNVNDEELEQFVKAVDKVQKLQEGAQDKMVKAIEEKDLDADRFNQINSMLHNPEIDPSAEVSQTELDNFEQARAEVEKIQEDIQNKQVQVIKEQGLEVERYLEIARGAQHDPELREKINNRLEN